MENGQALLDAGATIAWDGKPDTGTAADGLNYGTGTGTINPKAYALMPSIKAQNPDPIDVSNVTEDHPLDMNKALGQYIGNPADDNANPILNDNKDWPDGTQCQWVDGNGVPEKLVLDKAGQTYTGNIKITLPSGSSQIIKDVTIHTKANVIINSQTVDYGTKLTVEQLVKNRDVFPDNTKFEFVDNSEPN